MSQITPDLLKSLTQMFADAIKDALPPQNPGPSGTGKNPAFSIKEFNSSDVTSVQEYFTRFEWALDLSKIPNAQYANFARVYMGAELNSALKVLVAPDDPINSTFDEIKTILINHFDIPKNKYAESMKFRQIIQNPDESVANYALRLRNGAIFCEYGAFIDRMLIEQFIHGSTCKSTCDAIVTKKPDDFKTAFEVAQALESTKKASSEITVQNEYPQGESTNLLRTGKMQYKNKMPNNTPRQNTTIGSNRDLSNYSRRPLTCYGCGAAHIRKNCPHLNSQCFNCKRKGHIAKVCRSQSSNNQIVDDEEIPAENHDTISKLNKVNDVKCTTEKKLLQINIEGVNIPMELDSGAPCGILSKATLKTIVNKFKLSPSDRSFRSYTNHTIKCLGKIALTVTYGGTSKKLNTYIVDEDFDSLFGREWICAFSNCIDWLSIFAPTENTNTILTTSTTISNSEKTIMDELLRKYDEIFSDKPGKLKRNPATMHLKPGSTPVFARAREIPQALYDKYAKEIEKKLSSGCYERVESSRWASTTHIVTKKNGDIRITGNYKPTLNPRLIIDEHPIPKNEYLFNKMKGATIFCHLDITDAYTHMTVDEEFAEALTLNTPTHGLIRPRRAVYGCANIPAKWQREMESLIQDLPNVVCFFDDFLVFADTFKNLLTSLEKVLKRLNDSGIKLNKKKCIFGTPSVEFLGHKIDYQGIHKSDKHITAVRDAPKPMSHDELELFLGKATYYNGFIPNLATVSRPLRNMLKCDNFSWTIEGEQAYTNLKQILISPQVLTTYDPAKKLILATDASKVGLGAVLSHRFEDGTERPISYASRCMTATEQRYPQIDKEALAIVWAVQKFFYYLYARNFILITDHKPLTQILHPEKSLPVLCISRMANYADYLAHFNFTIEFKRSKENANADYCSRAIQNSNVNHIGINSREVFDSFDDFDQYMLCQVNQLPVQVELLAQETRKDAKLGKILQLLQTGQCLQKHGFKPPEANYSIASNCLVFEHRVVIPDSLQQRILADLHAAHAGIVRTKSLARSYVYWPGIDSEIEKLSKSCPECNKYAHALPKFNEHHWEYPKGPWQRVHMDFAGPIADTMLLIIVDAYSKWLEVKPMSSTTSSAVISVLDELFSAYGIPITMVSDNGPQFISQELKTFLKEKGVKYHKFIAPYHPSTNGQAERYVETTKDALKKMNSTKNSIKTNINVFLQQYRKTQHATTGQAPAELFLGRNIRTRLDLLRPIEANVRIMEKQQLKFNPSYRIMEIGQPIYFLSGNTKMDKWVAGTIQQRIGDLHYNVKFKERIFKRHIDQIRPANFDEDNPFNNQNDVQPSVINPNNGQPSVIEIDESTPMMDSPQPIVVPQRVTSPRIPREENTTTEEAEAPLRPFETPRIPRCSQRIRRAPLRFSPQL